MNSTGQGQTKPRLTSIQREQRFYDALRRIAKGYQTSERLLRNGDCGQSAVEALEMAYDNIQEVARRAIHGMRRPKIAPSVPGGLKSDNAGAAQAEGAEDSLDKRGQL